MCAETDHCWQDTRTALISFFNTKAIIRKKDLTTEVDEMMSEYDEHYECMWCEVTKH